MVGNCQDFFCLNLLPLCICEMFITVNDTLACRDRKVVHALFLFRKTNFYSDL